MKTVYVFPKDVGDIINQINPELNAGETISSLSVGLVTPASTGAPNLTITSGNATPIQFLLTGGQVGVTYGFPLTVTTNQRTFVLTVATVVKSSAFDPYQNADPDSYQDLVGELHAGKSALARSVFTFPPSFDPSGGYVTWDILDAMGTIYASGNAFDLKIVSTGVGTTVIARSIINVPLDIPPQVDNPYQLRYTLTVGEQSFPQWEMLQVTGLVDIPVGAQDSIELRGDLATVTLVTAELYQNYVLELWQSGNMIATMTAQNPDRVSSGYCVSGTIDTTNLVESCIPYQVLWKFWNNPAQTFRERASLWVITDSMADAISDVQSKVNKARTTLYGTADSQFPSTEIMKWLRRGMDQFNGAYGQFTSFTMTRAMGVVREFWLLYAEKSALESQYLLEAEKAFNFSGANITLDVDKTQYLDNMASKIQSQLDSEVPNIKKNLIIKGNTSGDGSGPNGDGNFSALQRGAIGSVGVTITQASIYGSGYGLYGGPYGYGYGRFL